MNEVDFILDGYENRHCRFVFNSGKVRTGVITTFFPEEPHTFYFVETSNMTLFQARMNQNDYSGMRRLCEIVRLGELKSAQRLDVSPAGRLRYLS